MDATLPARTRSTEPGPTNETRLAPLALAALGVVFGDIGTSPLYAFKQCFTTGRGFTPSAEHVLGILSLITWALILVVCVKYATIVLRADNEGEGGTLALLAQLRPSSRVGIPAPMTFVVFMLLFAARLHEKQSDQDPDRDRHDERMRRARRDPDPLDRREHRDHPGDLGALGGRGDR